jgi:hypothetical protein
MLVDMMSGAPIKRVPYEREYRRLMSRMTDAEVSDIKQRLNEMIEAPKFRPPAGCRGRIGAGRLSIRFTRRLHVETRIWLRAVLG